MTKRYWSLSIACVVLAIAFTTGCSQNTIAALVATLGSACSTAAGAAGDAALSQAILADTSTASAQALAWKSGTPTQNVEQALGDLEADLSKIPETAAVAPFIDLGIATIDGILTDITGQAPAAATAELGAHLRNVSASVAKPVRAGTTGNASLPAGGARHPKYSGNLPKKAADFVTEWNKLVAANPKTGVKKL